MDGTDTAAIHNNDTIQAPDRLRPMTSVNMVANRRNSRAEDTVVSEITHNVSLFQGPLYPSPEDAQTVVPDDALTREAQDRAELAAEKRRLRRPDVEDDDRLDPKKKATTAINNPPRLTLEEEKAKAKEMNGIVAGEDARDLLRLQVAITQCPVTPEDQKALLTQVTGIGAIPVMGSASAKDTAKSQEAVLQNKGLLVSNNSSNATVPDESAFLQDLMNGMRQANDNNDVSPRPPQDELSDSIIKQYARDSLGLESVATSPGAPQQRASRQPGAIAVAGMGASDPESPSPDVVDGSLLQDDSAADTHAASMATELTDDGQVVAKAVTRHDLEEEIEQRIIAQATVGEVVDVKEFDTKSPEEIQRGRCKIALAVAVVVGLITFLSAFFALRSKEDDTQPPAVDTEELQAFLVTASLDAFETDDAARLKLAIPGSPQEQAMDWLATNLESFPVHNATQEQRILETYALATLFFGTGGNETWDGGNLQSWMVGTDACVWLRDPDADCNNNGLVERLALAQANMTSALPEELLFLTQLEELDVADNSLTGSLPSTGLPTSLRTLKLDNNRFEGEIPTEMAGLGNLSYLGLTQNKRLRASLPEDVLSSWTNLETLRLDETPIYGSIPTTIGKMAALKEFSAREVSLSGEIPSQIGLCQSLQTFRIPQYSDLSSNITGFLPEEFWAIPSLESIDLQYVGLAFTIPGEHMEHLGSSLKSLNFGTTRIHGTLPTEIGYLSSLENLEMDNSVMLGGTVPSQIGTMEALRVLDLSRDPVMFGGLPTQVGNLENLEKLWIFSSPSFNETMMPSEIGRCSKLQSLFLKGSEKATGSIPTEIGLLSDLVELELLKTSVTGSIPSQLGLLQNFEVLTIGGQGVTGTLPTELAMAASLTKILAAGTRIGGTIPAQYGALRNMDKLALSNNQLTGTLPLTLSSWNKLDSFSINGNEITGTIPLGYSNWYQVSRVMIYDTNITGELDSGVCGSWGEENEVQADCEEVSCDSCCTHCCLDGECGAVNGEDEKKPGKGKKIPSFYPPIRNRNRIRGRA